MSRVEWDVKPG